MAAKTTERTVLLAIKPRFANAIMAGEKTVEFRKTRFRDQVSRVVVYASSPMKRVIGYFEVSHVDEDAPAALWERYADRCSISKDEMMAYYADCDTGVAIGVGRTVPLPKPVPLRKLKRSLPIPQSFFYLDERAVDRVLQHAMA